jgi:hypothetical protein
MKLFSANAKVVSYQQANNRGAADCCKPLASSKGDLQPLTTNLMLQLLAKGGLKN